MRVLVFHGYLLRGTGSNVYNASLAAALVRLGHEVHLLCQERHAAELEFVGEVGDWDSGALEVTPIKDVACTVYRPDIGGLLPVYVPDRYEQLEARPFPELSDAQLDFYLEANVAAVAEVAARVAPEAALANHLVMGPAILARALSRRGVRYAVKIHGSALEYTVKPHPRFLPYAREGLAAASGVLVGSRHTAESLWETLGDSSLPERTRLGPPGVDVHTFRPLKRQLARERVRVLSQPIANQARGGGGGQQERSQNEPASSFDRDRAATARALGSIAGISPTDPLVGFVGKLILAKGIDLLLMAWPLVLAELPTARLAVVGFGEYRAAAEALVQALSSGDLEEVRELALRRGAGGRLSLRLVKAFLDELEGSSERQRYTGAARQMRHRVTFTGRLEHQELADVLPLCEAIVVPSTFPESFGMVAAEAAACGVLPISAAHSGLAEVSRTLAESLAEPLRKLISFPLEPDAIGNIAARVLGWLRAPQELKDSGRAGLVHAATVHYSWEGVAQTVLAAARGELELLESAR